MEKESITAKETEEEIARLKRLARKTHDVKLRRRYDMIRLFLSKRAKPEIAAILDIKLPYCTVSIELSGILLVLEYKSRYLKVIGLKNAIDNSFSTFSSGCSGGLYEKLNRFK